MAEQPSFDEWASLRAGEKEALVLLYQRHYVGMLNFGMQWSTDRDFVTSCVTETFLQLWDKHDHLPKVQFPRAYIMATLKRIILQHFRSDKSRIQREILYQQDLPDITPSHEDYVSRTQAITFQSKILHKHIQKLTKRQQELLKLRFYDDMSYDEIAAVCQISKRTAYNIIQDALKELRKDFSAHGNNYSASDLYVLLFFAFSGLYMLQ